MWWWLDNANFAPDLGYDLCSFCEQLNLLVSLKATMITYSTQYWGLGVAFMDGTLPTLWGRMVASINYAFDCAGLKRPVIQGGIWETMESSVCRVEIPPCVINHFYDKIVAAGPDAINRYLNQSPVHFSYRHICRDDPNNPDDDFPANCTGECASNEYPPTCYSCHPDFSKLETRMWFYHVGIMLIDAGFTSILIGDGPYMGANAYGTGADNFHQTSIVNDLRAYAAGLPQPTELIIKLESDGDYLHANEDGVFPSNQLLADYHAAVLRPREIFVQNGTPVNVGDLNDQNTGWQGCENSDGNYDPAMFGPDCNGLPYLAFFDPCHSGGPKSPSEQIEGTTPNGCETEHLPKIFTWDSGPNCYAIFPEGNPSPPGKYYLLQDNNPNDSEPCDLAHLQNCTNSWDPSSHSVWGWDESTLWSVGFKPILPGAVPDPATGIVAIDIDAPDNDDCRIEWLKETMKTIRDLTPEGNSSLVLKTFDAFSPVNNCANTITPVIPLLDLSDPFEHPGLQDQLEALWEPNLVDESFIGIKETCISSEGGTLDCAIGCGNIHINQFAKKYTFYVTEPDPEDPDLTSLYKFRIEKLTANDILIEVLSDFSYGKEKSVVLGDLQPGEKIRITLQQINMGLIGTPFNDADGVIEVSKTFDFEDLNPCCSTDPIPVEVSRPASCWLKLTISDADAAGVDQFYWTTVPAATIIPQNANASEVLVNLYNVNANYLVFCVAGLDESGILKVGQGVVSPLNNEGCRNKSLIISPIPNPVQRSEMLNVLLSGDAMDEIQLNSTPLTLNIIRNSDGNLVHTFETTETNNAVDVSNFQSGMHWIVTGYDGLTYSTSFIVSDQ